MTQFIIMNRVMSTHTLSAPGRIRTPGTRIRKPTTVSVDLGLYQMLAYQGR